MQLEKTTLEFNTAKLMEDVRKWAQEESLRAIEAKCGVSPSTLSRIDNGLTPDMPIFMRLCEAFRLQPGDYFTWIEWTGKPKETGN